MKESLTPKILLDGHLKYVEPKKNCLSCGQVKSKPPYYLRLFYGMLLLAFFGYAYTQRQQISTSAKTQTIAHGRIIQYVAVEENNRKGLSLMFQNDTSFVWHIKSVSFNGERYNILTSIDPGRFYGVFIPAENVKKTRRVKFSVEEE